MSEEDREPPRGVLASHWETPTLLSRLPIDNAAVSRELAAARLGDIHYAAIGRVAAAWARFEAVMDGWLFDFARINAEVGVCFSGQMIGARPRVDSFIALARYRGAGKKWIPALEQIAKDTLALGEQRNRAVHDVWELSNPTKPYRVEATSRRVVRLLEIHVPTEELLKLVDNIAKLEERFHCAALEIAIETEALPNKSPPDTAA